MAELVDSIRALFRIDLAELSLAAALNQLAEEGRVEGRFSLTEAERSRLEAVAAESHAIAAEALAEWRASLVAQWTLDRDQLDALVRDLATFLRTVLRRHGAEASLLLYPDSSRCQELYQAIEEDGFDFLPASSVPVVRDVALSSFIRDPTPAQGNISPRTSTQRIS